MKNATTKPVRCAIYTRVSTEHGLEQEFNSLHNQREAAEAYIKSQAHEGWRLLPPQLRATIAERHCAAKRRRENSQRPCAIGLTESN